MVKTAEISSKRLGQIFNNINSAWYNALRSAILNLTRQHIMISIIVIAKDHEIFYILLRNILRSILIFKNCFENSTLKQKLMLFVTNVDTDLSLISLEKYKYDSDLDVALPPVSKSLGSLESTLLSYVWACTAFVNVASKTKITCKKTVNEEKKVILKVRAKETMKLLRGA